MFKILFGTVIATTALLSLALTTHAQTSNPPPHSAPNACGMQLNSSPPIFCDTFSNTNPGISSRTGDLDPNVWGVSRLLGIGLGSPNGVNPAAPAQLVGCDGISVVSPPRDVIICNGQLREAVNDNGGVTVLAMYPKQPFDFEGRTGTVSFDVSNDTQGAHAVWPEFWVTDTPTPAPFSHFNSWIAFPRNGFGVRFGVNGEIGQYGLCPNGKNLNKRRWTVDSAVVVRDYAYEDTVGYRYGTSSGLKLTILDCVIASPGPNGPLNHVELRVSQKEIEVYASDAGSTALRKIATIANANLSLTRGLVWLQHAHYNAQKGACPPVSNANPVCQDQHTFTWDNLAFDGPFTYRDFSFDALDNNSVNRDGTVQLGKSAGPNELTRWQVLNMPPNPEAASVRVLFNWSTYPGPVPTVLNVRVNGNMHSFAYPYPANDTFSQSDGTSFGMGTWRTLPVTIPITDLVAGTNVVEIGSDVRTAVTNVNIVLVNVPGGVPVLPGSNNAYPGSSPKPAPAPTPPARTMAPPSTKFAMGRRIQTTANVNVRHSVEIKATMAGAETTGSSGTAIGHATANGISGQVAKDILAEASTLAPVLPPKPSPGTFHSSANCNLSSPAFCDTFDQGPSAVPGRGGDLDPTKWSASRLVPDIRTDVVNYVAAAPIPACKASFESGNVFPPDDTLICDGSGSLSPQLMTAVAMQNYGVNSYMIRQPFDFEGRAGKIVFDVELANNGRLGAFVGIAVTEDPLPAPTFREFENFEPGPTPKNGLMLKWDDTCGSALKLANISNTMVYDNYVGTIIKPTFSVSGAGCANTRQGSLNHVELQISQDHIDVYTSDYSTDNGVTFRNFRKVYSADIFLQFKRGYVHVAARNHATRKYGFGPAGVFRWDNIGFDGPVITSPRSYEAPNNATRGTLDGEPVMNLGYVLPDGTNGRAAGMYDPHRSVASLTFQGVDISDIASAKVTLSASANAITHTPDTTWGWKYRFNGGAWRVRNLTTAEATLLTTPPGSAGFMALMLDVQVGDLISGANTFEIVPMNLPMDYAPQIENVDLFIYTSDQPH